MSERFARNFQLGSPAINHSTQKTNSIPNPKLLFSPFISVCHVKTQLKNTIRFSGCIHCSVDGIVRSSASSCCELFSTTRTLGTKKHYHLSYLTKSFENNVLRFLQTSSNGFMLKKRQSMKNMPVNKIKELSTSFLHKSKESFIKHAFFIIRICHHLKAVDKLQHCHAPVKSQECEIGAQS